MFKTTEGKYLGRKLKELREIETEKTLDTNEVFYLDGKYSECIYRMAQNIKVEYTLTWVTLSIDECCIRIPNYGNVENLERVINHAAEVLLWMKSV